MSNTFSPANWNDKHYNSANVEEERKKTHITNRYWHWGRANKWHVKIYHISKAMKIDKNKFSIFIPIWAEVEGKRKKKWQNGKASDLDNGLKFTIAIEINKFYSKDKITAYMNNIT